MEYLSKYQTNDICLFCNKYHKSCQGKMFELYKPSVNHYCSNFEDRYHTSETTEKHIKRFSEYTNKKN